MKTRSFPLNKFKFSGSLPSSHFLSSLTRSEYLLSAKAIPKPQTSPPAPAFLTSPPSLALSTHKPGACSLEKLLEVDSPTCSLGTGWVEGRESLRGPARPPGPGAERVPPQSQEGDFHADLHPSHSSPHASSPSHLRKLAMHSPKLQTHTRTCHASEMDRRPPPPRNASHTDRDAGAASIPFTPGSFLVPVCLTTITLATKELPRLALASQFLLKPGWRPAHDKTGEPGSRQLSRVEGRPNPSGHCSPECRLLLLFHLLGATLRGGDRRGLSEQIV